jgi:phenylacetate-CoA ligase
LLGSFDTTYHRVFTPRFLKQSQWYPRKKIQELQLEGLKQLVKHAKETTQHYKNFKDIDSLQNLNDLPILTKKDIRNNFTSLRSNRVPGYTIRTSGTVSKSTTIKDNRLKYDFGEKRFLNWYDKPTIRRCWVWAMLDIGPKPKKIGITLYLPVESMRTRKEAIKYLKMIDEFKPEIIHGYANSLRFLAHFAIEENIHPEIGVIQSACEVLTSEARNDMMEAFNCEIFNHYGSRELGSMAQDCKEHNGLHINSERYIVEEEDGRLLFTDLLNYAMPLIRYENQDMGVLTDRRCNCGRGLPLIESLYGRMMDFLLTKKDTWVRATTHGVIDKDPLFEWVASYQYKQEKKGEVTVLLKPWSSNEKIPHKDLLEKKLSEAWSKEELEVKAEVVDQLMLSPSGKQLYSITKFTPWEM